MVGGAVIDIATAGNAARRWNRTHAPRLAPVIIPSGAPGASGATYGLAVIGTF